MMYRYVYPTHDYIRMEKTVLYLKFHSINCRFNGRKYPFTTIKSPIDAVKFSNTIQLSPNYLKHHCITQESSKIFTIVIFSFILYFLSFGIL